MYEITISKACEGISCLTIVDWIQFVILALSFVAIIISIRSLNHAKRSFLVKESYEPILDEILGNEKIKIDSTNLYNFKYLKEIKGKYVYQVLEKKQQSSIDSIIQNSKKVNDYKRKLSDSAYKEFIEEVNERLLLDDSNGLTIGDIQVTTRIGKRKFDVDFFDLFINGGAFEEICIKNSQIICSMGSNQLVKRFTGEENIEINEFITEERIFIYDLVKGVYKDDSKESSYSNYGVSLIETFFNDINKKLTYRFEENSSYKDYAKNHKKLINEVSILKSDINEIIKELLISNYKLKKVFRLK